MKADDPRAAPLQHHMEYLLELGEVHATRVVATLVDGVQGHANREDTVDMVYLPISMGFCSCGYKLYMNLLGFWTRCKPDGRIVVDGIEDKGFVDGTDVWTILQQLEEELLSLNLSVLLCIFKLPQVLCQSHGQRSFGR